MTIPNSLHRNQFLLLLGRNLLPLALDGLVDLALAHAREAVHQHLLLLLALLQVEGLLALRHQGLLLLAVLLEEPLLVLLALAGLPLGLHGHELALEFLLASGVLGLLDLDAQVGHLAVAVLVEEGIGLLDLGIVGATAAYERVEARVAVLALGVSDDLAAPRDRALRSHLLRRVLGAPGWLVGLGLAGASRCIPSRHLGRFFGFLSLRLSVWGC